MPPSCSRLPKAADERNNGDLANLKEWTSKLPGQVLRLAGSCMWPNTEKRQEKTPVDYFSMKEACDLAWTYYIDHARHAHQIMGDDKNMEKAGKLLKAIDKHNFEVFTAYDAARNLRDLSFKKARTRNFPEYSYPTDETLMLKKERKSCSLKMTLTGKTLIIMV